jgi:glycosyltransferase involved in cell wall biosynthesis
MRNGRARRVLIVVQNLPVPLDRRVWLESRALVDAGVGVSVICPRGDDPANARPYEVLKGVHIHRYAPPPQANGALGFAWEYVYCFVATLLLAIKVRRSEGFDVIQACNPPDTFWALALLFRPFGVRFVYDQHDPTPEVYTTRFARPSRVLHAGLRLLERASYRTAERVIVTNALAAERARELGPLPRDRVTVVRSGPDANRFRRQATHPELRQGRQYLCCYLGIMGPQDGVDTVVRAADVIVHELGRDDISFAILGFGDSFDELRTLATSLDLDDHVEFTGKADDVMLTAYLSSADVGLVPDKKTSFNDIAAMNKTVEYMAFELPIVATALRETMLTADGCGVFVDDPSPKAFAAAIVSLLEDERARREMGARGRRRVETSLAWDHQASTYVETYRQLLDLPVEPTVARAAS